MGTVSAKPTLLVIGMIGKDLRDGLARDHHLVDHPLEGPNAKPLAGLPTDHDAVVTRALFGVPQAVMEALPDLRLVVSLGAGLEKIDLGEARKRNIAVIHTPDQLTEDTADYAIALTCALLRKVVAADRFVRQGLWAAGPIGLSRRIRGKAIGIVGLGKIGGSVAMRAAALGMVPHYFSRRPRPDCGWVFQSSLLAMAEAVDVLVLCCAGTAETRHLVNGQVLAALGPNAYLVNIARGSVVDEEALIAALSGNLIAGAALDVFAREPDPDPRLLSLDNVILSPHSASLTTETRVGLVAHLVSSAKAYFAGEAFANAADLY